MSTVPLPAISRSTSSENRSAIQWDRWANRYARLALGAAFLSGIASRFGWWGKNVGYGTFENFVKYTAQVNSFMPASTIPFLAWSATIAELFLGVALFLGIWRQWVAWGSALLLLMFGTAMAISFGLKEPLDYSVFSASAAALLLAQSGKERGRKTISPEVKAFINSIVNPTPDDARGKVEPAHTTLRRVAQSSRAQSDLIAAVLDELGPYGRQLRPDQEVRRAVANGARGNAIGHHALA